MTPSRKVGTRCLAIMEQLAGGVGDSGRGLMLADALVPLLQQSAASRYTSCPNTSPFMCCYKTQSVSPEYAVGQSHSYCNSTVLQQVKSLAVATLACSHMMLLVYGSD